MKTSTDNRGNLVQGHFECFYAIILAIVLFKKASIREKSKQKGPTEGNFRR